MNDTAELQKQDLKPILAELKAIRVLLEQLLKGSPDD